MKLIPLYHRSVFKPILNAIVDDEDYEFLIKFNWSYREGKKTFYARTAIDGKSIDMHQLLLPTNKPLSVDHKNGNGLDNRRENLRIATVAQQQWNSRIVKAGASSQYRGVTFNKAKKKWVAGLMVKGVHVHLGYFLSEREAALAYNHAAIEHFGEFANLNEVLPNGK